MHFIFWLSWTSCSDHILCCPAVHSAFLLHFLLSSVCHILVLWLVAQLCPTLCHSMGFSREEYWSRLLWPPPGDLPNLGIKPRSPALQADSLPSVSPGKPKNTGVSSLSLLQGIFLTKQSNQGFLHCRQILYQLSYQESPSAANFLAMIWGYHIKPSPKLQSACLPNGTTGSPSRDSRLIYVLQ